MTKSDEKVAVYANGIEVVFDLEEFPHGELFDRRKDDKYDIEFYSVPKSIRVPSYDPATGSIVWMPVKCWSVHRGKQLEVVTLADGSQIYTDDDPRAIYGVAADGKALAPERFTPTQAIERKVLVPVTTDSLAVIPHDKDWYDFETGDVSPVKHEKSVPLGFEFGQFIGLIAGDGWSDKCRVAWLADHEKYNHDFILAFMRQVYPGFYTTAYEQKKADDASRYGDTTRYRLNAGTLSFGDRVKELVDGHGDEQTSSAANKHLPMWFQFGSHDFIEGIVCGLIATDGTVAVSNGKKTPQLQIQYSSTSFRLAREFQRCCRLLGCRCTVSHSKRTRGGNDSWLCIVSTADAKRVNLLARCCHERKRDTFLGTPVSEEKIHVRNDILPFPSDISAELVACIPAVDKPTTDEERELETLCINVRQRATTGRITRYWIRQAVKVGERLAAENKAKRTAAISALQAVAAALDAASASGAFRSRRETHAAVDSTVADVLRAGVKACQTRLGDTEPAYLQLKMLYGVRKKGYMTYFQVEWLADFFATTPAQTELRDSVALAQMVQLADSDIRWEEIENVEKTGVELVGYDLTVPGYDTFVNADGVVLSNTMNFHVPASDKAVTEAVEKMLPSKNLFSTTDLRSPRYVPMMELTLGLAKLTAPQSNKKPKVFLTAQDAIRAYRRGEVGANDPVSVLRP